MKTYSNFNNQIVLDGENIDSFDKGIKVYNKLDDNLKQKIILRNFRAAKLNPIKLFLAKCLKKIIS